jgi:hypothetical protein
MRVRGSLYKAADSARTPPAGMQPARRWCCAGGLHAESAGAFSCCSRCVQAAAHTHLE